MVWILLTRPMLADHEISPNAAFPKPYQSLGIPTAPSMIVVTLRESSPTVLFHISGKVPSPGIEPGISCYRGSCSNH